MAASLKDLDADKLSKEFVGLRLSRDEMLYVPREPDTQESIRPPRARAETVVSTSHPKEWEAAYFKLCREGTAQEVAAVLDQRPSALNASRRGYTGLMYAVYNNKEDIVDLFLARKAELDSVNDDGGFALLAAADKGFFHLARKLRQHGARIESQVEGGSSALTYAALRGYERIVGYLLEKGADVNHQDKKGWTPLMFAIANNNAECAEKLLKYWPKLDVVNQAGKDVFAICREYKRNKLLDILHAEPVRREQEGVENIEQITTQGIKKPVTAQRLQLTRKGA